MLRKGSSAIPGRSGYRDTRERIGNAMLRSSNSAITSEWVRTQSCRLRQLRLPNILVDAIGGGAFRQGPSLAHAREHINMKLRIGVEVTRYRDVHFVTRCRPRLPIGIEVAELLCELACIALSNTLAPLNVRRGRRATTGHVTLPVDGVMTRVALPCVALDPRPGGLGSRPRAVASSPMGHLLPELIADTLLRTATTAAGRTLVLIAWVELDVARALSEWK